MTSPFRFKYPFPPQAQLSTPLAPSSSQLSARNFIIPNQPWNTPTSSAPAGPKHGDDDIDDPLSDEGHLPRKRTRHSPVHDVTSDSDSEDISVAPPSSVADTPLVKRPPVILPHPTPESPPIDFSPSRRQPFLPNGLATYMAKLIQEHNALSSVPLLHLDQEDRITVTETKPADGAGTICRVNISTESVIVLFLASKGLSTSKQIRVGDTLSISNAIKLDKLWICSSWHHISV